MPENSAEHQINPNKLLLSKWTALTPRNKEKHFIVTDVDRDEQGVVIACLLEAVLSKNVYAIDWRDLKDANHWLVGWK